MPLEPNIMPSTAATVTGMKNRSEKHMIFTILRF